ncbi:MAG: alpha/beta hydrolase [Actinomycetota bacterium]|nr:alpha/beta hydrolase [Actinomycetota bacterium]
MVARSSRPIIIGVLLGVLLGFVAPQAKAADSPASDRPTTANTRIIKADGLSQWINCQGSGPLTLIVIPGLGTASSQWATVRPSLAKLTRTCVYDRPGLGHSPARSHPGSATNSGQQARELRKLLEAAGEPGPYVVLGHSYGGLVARSLVRQYPHEVSGLLLMEGVDPSSKGGSHYWHEAGQAIDMLQSRAAAQGDLGLQDKPLLVVSASSPGQDHLGGPTYGESAAAIAEWRAQQESATRLSSNAIQVVARSGHVVQQDNPKATLEAVRELILSARTHSPVHCLPVWHSLNSTCLD